MKLNVEADLQYELPDEADILLAVQVAQTADQKLVDDCLTIDGAGPLRQIAGEDGIGCRTWMRAAGAFRAHYRAEVIVERTPQPTDYLPIAPRSALPADAIPYLRPSRYCESDRFEAFVCREFQQVGAGAKIMAMADWIHDHVDYCPGSTDATTTAVDVFVSRRGVCRDYAHLMASFARAAGVPARLVSAYAWQLDPPDFHAVVEVWLGDAWHMVDATRLAPVDGLARIAVGRDATDIAFMTIFGNADLVRQTISVVRTDEP